MKKLFSFSRTVSFFAYMFCLVMFIINKNIFWKNMFCLSIVADIVTNFLCVITKVVEFKEVKSTIIMLVFALFFSAVLPNVKTGVAPVYDLSTEVGRLQQEIYEQSGVYTFYNTDVQKKADIVCTNDYHISDDTALRSLEKIKEVLAFYSNGLPKEIYIVNDFESDGDACNGIYANRTNTIVLREHVDIDKTLHHELGHSIEDKTFNPVSLIKFKAVKDSCKLVSDYACTNDDELFAETWREAVVYKKTTNFSKAIADIFKRNIRAFDNPNYVVISDFEDSLSQLINGDIDSFVIKKSEDFSIYKLSIKYPATNNVHYLDVGDEMLFY